MGHERSRLLSALRPGYTQAGSAGVLELRQILQRFLSRSRQFDLAAGFVENEALKRDGYHMAADVQETSDLQHREKNFVFPDNDVLDSPDLLVLIVDDAAADQLARAIAFRNGVHVDDDEL